MTVTTGETATLKCNYTASNFGSLQWYKQRPQKCPEKIMILILEENVEDRKFSGSLDKKQRTGIFNISNSQAEDSATYYCAVEAQY
ncbi:TVA29 protein, partial [Amia calva]|nr:TVA29 protein [Amia calva]